MKCHIFKMLVQRYYDGELEPAEKAEYENHRSRCSGCREFDMQFAGIFTALGDMPLLSPSEQFDAKVMANVDISRYRTSATRKLLNNLGLAWGRIPVSVRTVGVIAAVFAVFIAAFRPFLLLVISAGEIILGSSVVGINKVLEKSGTIIEHLTSTTNYRLAGETLLRNAHKVFAVIPHYDIAIGAVVIVGLLIVLVVAARTAWKKGESNAGVS